MSGSREEKRVVEENEVQSFESSLPERITTEGSNDNQNESKSPKRQQRQHRQPRRMSVPEKKTQLGEEIINSLNPVQLKQMLKVSEEYLHERELKRLRLLLQDKEDHCKTAMEIVKNLEKENEDFKTNIDNLKNQLRITTNEMKILETKLITINENYEQEKKEYDFVAKEKEDKIQELMMVINDNDSNINNKINNDHNKEKEDLLQKEIEELEKKVNDRDLRLERAMEEIENYRNIQEEYEKCQNEIKDHQQLRQRDSLQTKSIEKEVIALASRNSFLENDKTNLLNILDEKDYEIMQLKTLVELKNTNNSGHQFHKISMDRSTLNNDNTLDCIINENGDNGNDNECEYDNDNDNDYEKEAYDDDNANSMENKDGSIENQNVTIGKESKKSFDHCNEKNVKIREIPDVLKEYLHLTASAVKIKFPSVTTMTSEQLIGKVQHVPFCDYHDHMVRIMKNELINVEEEKKRLKGKNSQSNIEKSSNFLAKFKQFLSSFSDKHDSNASKQNIVKSNSSFFRNDKESNANEILEPNSNPTSNVNNALLNTIDKNVNANNDEKNEKEDKIKLKDQTMLLKSPFVHETVDGNNHNNS